jgi:hypothetical protein
VPGHGPDIRGVQVSALLNAWTRLAVTAGRVAARFRCASGRRQKALRKPSLTTVGRNGHRHDVYRIERGDEHPKTRAQPAVECEEIEK